VYLMRVDSVVIRSRRATTGLTKIVGIGYYTNIIYIHDENSHLQAKTSQ